MTTSVFIVSDDPLATLPTGALVQAGLQLTHLPVNELHARCKALQKAAILLWDVSGNVEACLQKITAMPPSPPIANVWLGEGLTRDERLLALGSGVLYIHASAPDTELALMLKNIARLIPAPNLSIREDDPQGDWVLDMARWHLRTPLGHDVQLQRAEAAILAQLFVQTGVQQSRQTLAASFKSDHHDKNRSLDVAISKIRKKVRDAANLGLPLRAIRGVGYIFVGNAHVISDIPSP